jgi:hypothetical protein
MVLLAAERLGGDRGDFGVTVPGGLTRHLTSNPRRGERKDDDMSEALPTLFVEAIDENEDKHFVPLAVASPEIAAMVYALPDLLKVLRDVDIWLVQNRRDGSIITPIVRKAIAKATGGAS